MPLTPRARYVALSEDRTWGNSFRKIVYVGNTEVLHTCLHTHTHMCVCKHTLLKAGLLAYKQGNSSRLFRVCIQHLFCTGLVGYVVQ